MAREHLNAQKYCANTHARTYMLERSRTRVKWAVRIISKCVRTWIEISKTGSSLSSHRQPVIHSKVQPIRIGQHGFKVAKTSSAKNAKALIWLNTSGQEMGGHIRNASNNFFHFHCVSGGPPTAVKLRLSAEKQKTMNSETDMC